MSRWSRLAIDRSVSWVPRRTDWPHHDRIPDMATTGVRKSSSGRRKPMLRFSTARPGRMLISATAVSGELARPLQWFLA
jgi:hypothetical protein